MLIISCLHWCFINCFLKLTYKYLYRLKGQLGQAGGDRRPAEACRGRLWREQERADSAHRPHQERGEGRDYGTAGHHQQKGPAISKVNTPTILSAKSKRLQCSKQTVLDMSCTIMNYDLCDINCINANKFHFRRMQALQQKIEGLSSSREEMERRTLRLRDALADVVAKVDNMSLDVKDAQGQVQLQNKMLDNQSVLQKQRGEDGAKMSDAQRLALDGK